MDCHLSQIGEFIEQTAADQRERKKPDKGLSPRGVKRPQKEKAEDVPWDAQESREKL